METTTTTTTTTKRSREELVNDDCKVISSDHSKETPATWKILLGVSENNDQAKLLVPSDVAWPILEALKDGAKGDNFFDWSIEEDTVIRDIKTIPSSLALSIRTSVGKEEVIPRNQTETELLDWLIHGDSHFSLVFFKAICHS